MGIKKAGGVERQPGVRGGVRNKREKKIKVGRRGIRGLKTGVGREYKISRWGSDCAVKA